MRSILFAALAALAAGCAQSPRADAGDTPREQSPGRVDLGRDTAARAAPSPQRAESAAAPTGSEGLAACFAQARPEPVPVNRRSPLSPPDSACTTVGGATVAVRYASPSVRGRTIFGRLEPYGRVWRAGANAATSFTTTRDLLIGGVTVPAGDYTLYVFLEEAPNAPRCGSQGATGATAGAAAGAGWKLIINKQIGQWGTDYDQAQDLARIPMRMCRTESPVERFEMRVTPRGEDAGTITLAWENTSASVDFRVKG